CQTNQTRIPPRARGAGRRDAPLAVRWQALSPGPFRLRFREGSFPAPSVEEAPSGNGGSRPGRLIFMLELVQFPWNLYCLVQRRILSYSGAPHKIVNILPFDRLPVWRLTRQRYYQVPVLKDGKIVVFET